MRKRLYRFYVYLKRAWMNYLAFPIGVMNFITIQYKLLVENSFLSKYIPSFAFFTILCILMVGVIGVIVGYLDYTRGTFVEETKVQARNNPFFWDQYQTVKRIEKRLEELEKRIK